MVEALRFTALIFLFLLHLTFNGSSSSATSASDLDYHDVLGVEGSKPEIKKDLLSLQIKTQWKPQQSAATSSSACFPSNPRSTAHKMQKGATIIEMKHRDSCFGTTKDRDKLLQQRLLSDHKYVQILQARIRTILLVSDNNKTRHDNQGGGLDQYPTSSLPSPETRIPLSSGKGLQILNYVTTMQIGGRNLTVIVDTGSDLTWVQCAPCRSCYSQQEPLFNPFLSPLYQTVPCNTRSCQSIARTLGKSGGYCGGRSRSRSRLSYSRGIDSPCSYYISYGDGSYTSGEMGIDRLKLGPTSAMDGFLFGCGRSNKGLFGSASGLMGLGRSDLSLVSQTAPLFGGVFSYCLPSGDDPEASGSLSFGPHEYLLKFYKNTTPVSYTKMVMNSQLSSSFYLVNLTGISVGGVNLHLPSAPAGFGNSGVSIDSGTVITRLPPSVYEALRGEFVGQFSGYPTAPGYSILDTCFDLSGYQEVSLPTVELHLQGGVEVKVDVGGVMYFVKGGDASQVCLAFASLSYEDEMPIIGNYQQKNLRVVYDTKQDVMGFAQEICSFG